MNTLRYLIVIIILGSTSCSYHHSDSLNCLTENDFKNFGKDPWQGQLPISEGQEVCIQLKPTTTGSFQIPIMKFEFYYQAENCFTNTTRRNVITFEETDIKDLKKFVGQDCKLYGIIKSIKIKRPEHACDEAFANIVFSSTEIEKVGN